MRKFIAILSMAFLILAVVAGCSKEGTPGATPGEKGTTNSEHDTPTTITIVAGLKSGYAVDVKSGSISQSLSTGQCLKVRHQRELVVSVKRGAIISQLCGNIDEDKTNDCKGSYNIVYKVSNPKTGSDKLALESTTYNKSTECIPLFPEDEVYTITLVEDFGRITVRVQHEEKAKILRGKGSCLKLNKDDFFGLQIDVGEGEENRRILCDNNDTNHHCNDRDKTNYEVGLSKTPEPKYVVLNPGTKYNDSANCEWLSEQSAN